MMMTVLELHKTMLITVMMMLVTALIIVICKGDTTVAVNLYALGVFTAFTLSQLGLVRRWWRLRGNGSGFGQAAL